MALYTVGLVEDQRHALDGLSSNIEWEAEGMHIAFAVNSGEAALKHIELQIPDILITDIKMAGLSGIDLAKTLYERHLETKVILISAFDEFEFAQQAIQLNVFEYILKPVDYTKLLSTCKGAIAEIEQDRIIRYHIKNSLPALREKFFIDLVNTSQTSQLQIQHSQYLGITFNADRYLCVIICLDQYDLLVQNMGIEQMEILQYKLSGNIGQLAAWNPWAFRPHKDRIALLLGFSQLNTERFYAELYQFCEDTIENHRNKGKISITIGIGRPVDTPEAIHESFNDATFVEEHKFRMGCGRVYDFKDMPTLFSNEDGIPLEIEGVLLKWVSLGNKEQTLLCLERLSAFFSCNPMPKDLIQMFIVNFITRLRFQTLKAGLRLPPELTTLSSILLHVQLFGVFEDTMRWLQDYCLQICDQILESHNQQYLQVIQQVDEYIGNHYQNPSLSLLEIAREIGMNSTYLSTVYKRETGHGISEKISEVKLAKACELLTSTNMKIFEIASDVGFSNQYYFSATFKKQIGISPMEYRNQARVV